MVVFVDGLNCGECFVQCLLVGIEFMCTFACTPAKTDALHLIKGHDIDFFPFILTNIGNPQIVGDWVE